MIIDARSRHPTLRHTTDPIFDCAYPFVRSAQTAKTIGLTIPQLLLLQADEVIQ